MLGTRDGSCGSLTSKRGLGTEYPAISAADLAGGVGHLLEYGATYKSRVVVKNGLPHLAVGCRRYPLASAMRVLPRMEAHSKAARPNGGTVTAGGYTFRLHADGSAVHSGEVASRVDLMAAVKVLRAWNG